MVGGNDSVKSVRPHNCGLQFKPSLSQQAPKYNITAEFCERPGL